MPTAELLTKLAVESVVAVSGIIIVVIFIRFLSHLTAQHDQTVGSIVDRTATAGEKMAGALEASAKAHGESCEVMRQTTAASERITGVLAQFSKDGEIIPPNK